MNKYDRYICSLDEQLQLPLKGMENTSANPVSLSDLSAKKLDVFW